MTLPRDFAEQERRRFWARKKENDMDNQVDRRVLSFMAQNGGRFASCLANAWLSADAANSARLAQSFGDLYREYAENYAASRVAA